MLLPPASMSTAACLPQRRLPARSPWAGTVEPQAAAQALVFGAERCLEAVQAAGAVSASVSASVSGAFWANVMQGHAQVRAMRPWWGQREPKAVG